jgi:hypothetical protein
MEIGYQLQRSSRASKPTMKTRNKRVLIFFIGFLLLLGSTQAYAATVLDTNIVDLIKSGIKAVADSQVVHANTQSNAIEADYKTKLQVSVTKAQDDAANELSQFTESELTRARQELLAYLDEKKQQMNNVVTPQVELSKQDITQNINAIINAIKQNLDLEFQKQLKENWKH